MLEGMHNVSPMKASMSGASRRTLLLGVMALEGELGRTFGTFPGEHRKRGNVLAAYLLKSKPDNENGSGGIHERYESAVSVLVS
jgi:hypothetical protein